MSIGERAALDISKFIITDEQWATMSEEEKLRAVREGRFSPKLERWILSEGSEALREALSAYNEEHPPAYKALLGGVVNAEEFIKKLRGIEPVKIKDLRPLPEVRMSFPKIVTQEEIHEYESAQALISRLHRRYEAWMNQLPEDVQPAIYAVLSNGLMVRVLSLSPEGHSGVAISGEIEGTQCLIITHHAGVQLMCVAEAVAKGEERKPIGFIVPTSPQSGE